MKNWFVIICMCIGIFLIGFSSIMTSLKLQSAKDDLYERTCRLEYIERINCVQSGDENPICEELLTGECANYYPN